MALRGYGKKGIRDLGKMDIYKKAINRCCMPDCIYGNELETHHIQPLNKGGKDQFNNYIILCRVCHRKRKLHRGLYIKKTDLFIYKFYIEQSILGLGIMSEDYSDEEFQKLLRKYLYNYDIEVKNLKEEGGEE